MFDKKRYIRNIAFNWGAYLVSLAVGFLLAPFIVRTLGDGGYGYWSLVVTTVAWFGYLDLGIQSAVGHYIARHLADGDGGKLDDKANSALAALSAIGLLVLAASLIASLFFSRFFHVPAEAAAPVRAALLLMGLVAAAKFPMSVFQAMLVGAQRFDLVSGTSMAIKAANALMVYLALGSGKGLLGLALAVASTQLLEGLVLMALARRAVPGVRFRLFRFRPAAFRELFDYGAFNFAINVSAQLAAGFWVFILARKVGAEAVTYYSIGSEVIPYMAGVASAVTIPLLQAVIPMDVGADIASIREMFLNGSRYFFALICVMGSNLLLVGESFLGQWMGVKYLDPVPYGSSGTVLLILTAANMAALSSSVAQQILFGRRKNRMFALVTVAESLLIAGLALVLVPRHGIIGMAVATLIPLAIGEGVLIPALAARNAGSSLARYWLRAILPNLALTAAVFAAGRPALAWLSHAGWLPAPGSGWPPVFLSFTLVTVLHISGALAFILDGGHRRLLLERLQAGMAFGMRGGG